MTGAGTYLFAVVAMNAEGLTSPPSTITVYVRQVLTALGINSATATMPLGSSSQAPNTEDFSVVGVDQFGEANTFPFGLTWSRSGGGSINSSTRVFTAPTSGPSATVSVTGPGGATGGPITITFTPAGGGGNLQVASIDALAVGTLVSGKS